MEKHEYNWTFSSVGGSVRVLIKSGEDIEHLHELDRKMWTVLSCPVQDLEFDAATLKYIDANGDGLIHVDEVIDASKWICSLLKNTDELLAGSAEMPLDSFNTDNPEGKTLQKSAKQILGNLGLKKNAISIEDTADNARIFAESAFNGDGVITEFSSKELSGLIKKIVEISGGAPDRSGVQGITAEQIEAFYTALADYAAWKKAEAAPYGDATAKAKEAIDAVKAKVEDFFMRCKLINFNPDALDAVDVDIDKIKEISAEDLGGKIEDIASHPLARPNAEGILPLDEGINPAWQSAMAQLKQLLFPKAKSINESKWAEALASFEPYIAWLGEKKGAEVEVLGLEEVEKILSQDKKSDLLALVEKDKALEAEALSIETVDKVLHLYKNFFSFLNNYVVFQDFYSSENPAMFQAGQLYIDQRRCDLCIKVSDMGKQGDMAGLSGMYILYCACTSKTTGKSFNIAAVLTNGDIDGLRVGKNAIFYDRAGEVYDATVIKIIDNPVSLRQAWWAPYRKFGKWMSERFTKKMGEKNEKGFAVLTDAAEKAPVAEAPAAPASSFDIAKFAGIFAALGMAFSLLLQTLVQIIEGAAKLSALQLLVAIVAILLVISLPSVILTWFKLRKRDLGPILNANGWAVNATSYVNVKFGATLTKLVKYPSLASIDPEVAKKLSKRKTLWTIILVLLLAGGVFGTYKLIQKKRAAKAAEQSAVVTPVPAVNAADTNATAPELSPEEN